MSRAIKEYENKHRQLSGKLNEGIVDKITWKVGTVIGEKLGNGILWVSKNAATKEMAMKTLKTAGVGLATSAAIAGLHMAKNAILDGALNYMYSKFMGSFLGSGEESSSPYVPPGYSGGSGPGAGYPYGGYHPASSVTDAQLRAALLEYIQKLPDPKDKNAVNNSSRMLIEKAKEKIKAAAGKSKGGRARKKEGRAISLAECEYKGELELISESRDKKLGPLYGKSEQKGSPDEHKTMKAPPKGHLVHPDDYRDRDLFDRENKEKIEKLHRLETTPAPLTGKEKNHSVALISGGVPEAELRVGTPFEGQVGHISKDATAPAATAPAAKDKSHLQIVPDKPKAPKVTTNIKDSGYRGGATDFGFNKEWADFDPTKHSPTPSGKPNPSTTPTWSKEAKQTMAIAGATAAAFSVATVTYIIKKIHDWWNSRDKPVEIISDTELRAHIDKNLEFYYHGDVVVLSQADRDPKFRKRIINHIVTRLRDTENKGAKGRSLVKAGVLLPQGQKGTIYKLEDFQGKGRTVTGKIGKTLNNAASKAYEGARQTGKVMFDKTLEYGKKTAYQALEGGVKTLGNIAASKAEEMVINRAAKTFKMDPKDVREWARSPEQKLQTQLSASSRIDTATKLIDQHINMLTQQGRATEGSHLNQFWNGLSKEAKLSALPKIEKMLKTDVDPDHPVDWTGLML